MKYTGGKSRFYKFLLSVAKRGNLFMKKIISVTIEENLIHWLEKYSKDNQKYRNKSHFVEVAIRALKKKEEEE